MMVSGNVYFDGVCEEFGFFVLLRVLKYVFIGSFWIFWVGSKFLWYFFNFLGFMLEFLVGNKFFFGYFEIVKDAF